MFVMSSYRKNVVKFYTDILGKHINVQKLHKYKQNMKKPLQRDISNIQNMKFLGII